MNDLQLRAKAEVCAIVVSYQPDLSRLQALLQNLVLQAQAVLLVDNGSHMQPQLQDLAQQCGAHALLLPQNIGLAAGFNRGIAWAQARGASHVLLSDQDSAPSPPMLRQLLATEARLLAQGVPLAALGPAFVDVKTGRIGDVIGPERWYTRRKHHAEVDKLMRAAYLISSGQLIRTSVLQQVGNMHEEFFIDGVDIEWCLRAASLGLQCFCVCDAVMQHDLGEAVSQVGQRQIALHSPLRHYYIVRNSVLMLRMPHIPWRFKVSEAAKTLRRLLAFSLLCRPRHLHLQWMLRGLWHGVRGKSGAATT